MTQFERPMGRMVHRLNTETIKPVIIATLVDRGFTVNPDDIEIDNMVVARVKGDTYATICSEGVGWTVDKLEGTLPVTFWHGGWRSDYVDLMANLVLGHVSDEEVDLAEFVRMFGARLENNFHIWYNQTDGVSQVFDKAVAV